MSRGIFDFFAKNTAYKDSEKSWYVTLNQSTCFWFDLIVNPITEKGEKDPIVEYLKQLKRVVEETLEKRFIYFFASRPKVRFDLKKTSYYQNDSGTLVINLLIGRDRKEKSINVSFFGEPSKISLQPKVEMSEKFIILHFDEGGSATFSIHDFLCSNNIQLDLNTHIHYIGITKNPDSRPITREHRGVADTLYNISNEENDFFLFVNLFKRGFKSEVQLL